MDDTERCPIYDSCGWLRVWKVDGRAEMLAAVLAVLDAKIAETIPYENPMQGAAVIKFKEYLRELRAEINGNP